MEDVIYMSKPRTGSITVSKVITGLPLDNTYFNIRITGQSAEPTIVEGYVNQEGSVKFENLPFDTYDIAEEEQEGYILSSILNTPVTLSRSNRDVSIVVTNEEFVIETIKYGALYNWWAATDVRNIANIGWSVPSQTQYQTLSTYLGGYSLAGGKLKETGTIYWNAPNVGATNEVGFNARGASYRTSIGFVYFRIDSLIWSQTAFNATLAFYLALNSNSDDCSISGNQKYFGASIRLIKDSTTLTHGQTGTYTGNDGKVYRTICIGTQEWVADNLNETKYRNGDTIPTITDNTAWAALTTGAMCYYNNDPTNA